MIILFPSHELEPKQVDDYYKPESVAAELVGLRYFLFDFDHFASSGKLKCNLPPNYGETQTIMLRCYMLKEDQYQRLYDLLEATGYKLINTTEQYLNCHWLPYVYKHISEITPKSWWSGKWEYRTDPPEQIHWQPVRDLLGGDIIIKDYVKSEKGNPDIFRLGRDLSNKEFGTRVRKFIEARGNQFHEGIVMKQFEMLKEYEIQMESNKTQTNEWRLFFLNKKCFTFDGNYANLIPDKIPHGMNVDFVLQVIKAAQNFDSNFFTIDVAQKADGNWTILETGDGQVSGLAAQAEPIKFYNRLYNAINGIEQ